jgi:hypothetical protein
VSILPARVNYTSALLLVDECGKVENFASEAVNQQLHRVMQVKKAPQNLGTPMVPRCKYLLTLPSSPRA